MPGKREEQPMTLQLSSLVLGGELFNTRRNHVHGQPKRWPSGEYCTERMFTVSWL